MSDGLTSGDVMSEPIFDPNLRVTSENGPGGGQLVMTDEAVQRWVWAYRKHADAMTRIAGEIAQRNDGTFFGNLDSLRQLAHGYDQLMKGGEGSLHQRVLEFAETANLFADKLEADWKRILAADSESATALSTLELDW